MWYVRLYDADGIQRAMFGWLDYDRMMRLVENAEAQGWTVEYGSEYE